MMFKALILGLTMLLITLTAAQLGRSEQFKSVLRPAKTPIEDSSSSAQVEAPPVHTPPQPAQSVPPIATASSSEPPRFVMDGPIPDYTDGRNPLSKPMDPSAEVQLAPSSQAEIKPKVATPEEAQRAAEPFLKELYALKSEAFARMETIEKQAIADFNTSGNILALGEKFLPQVTQLMAKADEDAKKVVTRLSAALIAIGAPDTLAIDAQAAYQKEKQEKVDYYMQLIGTLSTQKPVAPSQAEGTVLPLEPEASSEEQEGSGL